MSLEIPKKKIVMIAPDQSNTKFIPEIIKPLAGEVKREWFSKNAYHCLPLVIGNQYGFAIRSQHDFEVCWNGGGGKDDVTIRFANKTEQRGQIISSHFGMGTITIQNCFYVRTPAGTNIMTINPPNYYIDGIHFMTGVVETDNLKRDFTFNLRLTRPNKVIRIKKGDLIGCILPIQRYHPDSFEVINGRNLFSESEITEGKKELAELAAERDKDVKKGRPGGLYSRGKKAFGGRFADHQTTVKRHRELIDFF